MLSIVLVELNELPEHQRGAEGYRRTAYAHGGTYASFRVARAGGKGVADVRGFAFRKREAAEAFVAAVKGGGT